ncbi:acetylglutamate kinase [Pullulanibacillus camelliae]|uniref:Acetylglutamate kinase n=1 Tax=Pullulanibacillus camelliae TaxID=1707096 RepID=A0A8J2VKS0_9BACL|nr:acetylglutamate kinase [Pullulanibacillus camelliae]GGE29319.1 acetylglutamate kinase [Pullulanibacillus camelliae]
MNYLVIKCGGSAFQQLTPSFYKNIIKILNSGNWQPIIVHGGGPLISTLLDKLAIPTHFNQGLRVTTEEVLDVVEMVLSGSVNKQIVRELTLAGGKAVGMSGVDGGLLEAAPHDPEMKWGYVGKIVHVETENLELYTKRGYIPVISPVAMDRAGQRYNINGDTAAAAIAEALNGHLCFVSDISGIEVEGKSGKKEILKQATLKQIEDLIELEVITGGMVPKVQAALEGLKNGVKATVILNGLESEQLLDYIQGHPVGTKITLKEAATHV